MGFPSPQHTQGTGVEGGHSGRWWATPTPVDLFELCSYVGGKSQVPQSLKQIQEQGCRRAGGVAQGQCPCLEFPSEGLGMWLRGRVFA